MLSLLPPARPEESDWFKLIADIGRNRANRRDDAIKVESLLANDGDPELRAGDGPSGRWGFGLDAAIRRFQKRNALKVDGWLRPSGPTIEALRERQQDSFAGFDVPTPDEIDAHHAAIAEGRAPLIAFASPRASFHPIPALPALRQADRGSNTSQLDWLDAHQIGLGEVPEQFARYVGLGPQGIAQARDFVLQFQRRWPSERDALVDGILDRLDADGQAAFLGAPRPQGAPFGTQMGGTRKAAPAFTDRLLRPDELDPALRQPHTMEMRDDRKVNLLERAMSPEMQLATAEPSNDDEKTGGGDAAEGVQVAEGKRFPPNEAKHDKFFDDYSAMAEKLAKELDIDPKYILSLMSLEGGWGDKGSREKNNLFGFRKNNEKMRFENPEEAAEYFKRIWGSSVEGARSIDEFVDGLQDQKKKNRRYNTDDEANPDYDYKREIRKQYDSIRRRQDNWTGRRSA